MRHILLFAPTFFLPSTFVHLFCNPINTTNPPSTPPPLAPQVVCVWSKKLAEGVTSAGSQKILVVHRMQVGLNRIA